MGCNEEVPKDKVKLENTKIKDNLEFDNFCNYVLHNEKGDKRPYLKVKIYGLQYVGLLDSGSSRTIIGKDGYRIFQNFSCNKINTKKECNFLKLANEHKLRIEARINIPIEIENRLKIFEVLYIPDIPHALILGQDFWREMGLVVDLNKNSYDFSEEDTLEHLAMLHPQSQLSGVQKEELDKFIEDEILSQKEALGCTSLVSHKIKCNAEPIKKRYFPVSPAIQEIMNEELEKMLKLGVVEPSQSPWSSRVLLAPKSDGGKRFCIDFRDLNRVSEKDAYPLPYISSILDKLRRACFLSSIDIKSAFWQVPMDGDSKHFTAFTVPNKGLFHFNRMPFGLTNAPATWQRLVDKAIGADLEPFVFIYLDDIIICTETFEKHMLVLREVMKRIKAAGLVVNKEKCELCRSELRYLGYLINENGLMVDPEKVSAIVNIPEPKTTRDIKSFIGLLSWYRRFIPDMATLVAPLNRLLSKKNKFIFDDECKESFRRAKECLISAPILKCPNFELPFTIQTDASDFGLGAVLSQTDEDGEHVVCYLSRSLAKNERKFSTTEKECLAVLWAIEKLRPYIEGYQFTIITDHHSLIWLNNLKDPNGRLSRWAVRLQQYDFEIIHRKGREHLVPDALSRSVPITMESLCFIQDIADKWYDRMRRKVEDDPNLYPQWRIRDGKLYKKIKINYVEDDDSWREVIPKSSRKNILFSNHDDATYGGFKIIRTDKENFILA